MHIGRENRSLLETLVHLPRHIRAILSNMSWRVWMRPGLALIVLAMAWVIAPRMKERGLTLFAALFAGVIVFLFFTRRLDWGLMMILPATFLMPIRISTGHIITLNFTLVLVALLLGVWFLRMVLIERAIHLRPSIVNRPALWFLGAILISFITGMMPLMPTYQPALPVQAGGMAIYFLSITGLLLFGNNINSIRWLKWFTWGFIVLGTVFTLFCWRYGIRGAEAIFFRDGISGGVFWTMLAALSFGQGIGNTELKWQWRAFAFAVCINSLAFGWIRGKEWVSGWAPAAIALFVLLWFSSWKKGLLGTVAVSILLIPRFAEFINSFNTTTQQVSTEVRLLTWPILFELSKIEPVFGLGFVNSFYYSGHYPLDGWYVTFNSHNNYWDLILQTGLFGTIIFLWLAISLGLLGWRLRSQVKDVFTRTYVDTALAVLVGCLASGAMADWFLPFLYNVGIPGFRGSMMMWVYLGGLIAVEEILRKEKAAADSAAQETNGHSPINDLQKLNGKALPAAGPQTGRGQPVGKIPRGGVRL